MDRARDQLLADACFARDQNSEVRPGDELDLAPHTLDGLAGSKDLVPTVALCSIALQHTRYLLVVPRRRLEGLDETTRVERRSCESPEHPQKALIEVVKGPGLEGIRREDADHVPSFDQRTPQARVDVPRRVGIDEQEAVIGIGEPTVRRKPDRCFLSNNDIETGMLASREATTENLGGKAVRRERNELITRQREDCSSIAGDGRANRVDEALKSVLGCQGGCEVDSDGQQRLQATHGY